MFFWNEMSLLVYIRDFRQRFEKSSKNAHGWDVECHATRLTFHTTYIPKTHGIERTRAPQKVLRRQKPNSVTTFWSFSYEQEYLAPCMDFKTVSL